MNKFLPLGEWLSSARDGEHIVAFDGKRNWTQERLLHDVHQLYGELYQQPGERWALCFDNSYRFIVALLATLHAGKTPVLPGHCRERLLHEQHALFSGVITDLPLRLACPVIHTLSLTSRRVHSLPPVTPDAGVVLFTSGSTGAPSQIFKSLQALNQEGAWLTDLWGNEIQHCRVIASVSHQHMYGLTFRIILPMGLGLACDTRMIHFPEELTALTAYPHLFISSPAFLKRLDTQLPAPPCCMTISAAGKLDDETAHRAKNWLSKPVNEIYGTTETGVLAWRKHLHAAPPWHPFPGVQFLRTEEQWTVHSPLIEGGKCQLDDQLTFTAKGQFHLLGRRDRIVKIEEKRISLSEIERRLLAIPGIDDAAVVLLQRGGRTALGAVVVWHASHAPDRQVKSQWRIALSRWLEPVAIPRYWRIVDAIPLNSQSKRAWAQLQELFDETS